MEISDKISLLIKEIGIAEEKAELSGEGAVFFEKLKELADIYIKQAHDSQSALDFASAHKYFVSANNVYDALYNKYAALLQNIDANEDENGYEYISSELSLSEQGLYHSQAYSDFCLGQLNALNRNPGAAVKNFGDAKANFSVLFGMTEDSIYELLDSYSASLELVSEGKEELYRLNYGNARMPLQRAIISLEEIIDDLPRLFDDVDTVNNYRSILMNDHSVTEQIYYFSGYKDYFDKGSFLESKEQAEKLCELCERSINDARGKLPESVLNFQMGDYQYYLGHRYLVEGEFFREKDEWESSLESYRKARAEWERGAYFYLKSGFPQAASYQETITNSTESLGVFIRNCKKERELKSSIKVLTDELDDLKVSLTAAIKPTGVVVNNSHQIVTAVEQNVQIVQKIENDVRQNVKDLVETLSDLPIEADKKEEVKTKADELLKSEEHGGKFIEKAKTITGDISDIVENLGDIAKPLLPIVSALAILL